jgi:hypothetical protein
MALRRTALALILAAALGSTSTAAQNPKPRASPHESVSGTVGGAAVSVTYGRPYMKGRKIFGALVPYGRVWCPGADEATVLESTRDLRIGDLTVPAGAHTIWVLPTEDAWTLIVSRDASGWHNRYPADADLGRVALQRRALDAPIEQLTFEIRETGATSGVLAMKWETTEVSVPFETARSADLAAPR